MKATWECAVLLLALMVWPASVMHNITSEENISDILLAALEKRCGNNTDSDQYGTRGCACDPDCRKYGDCCPDTPYFKPEEQKLGASPFVCNRVTQVYLVSRCPHGLVDPMVRRRCEHPDETFRDPLRDVPVTSLTSNVSYVNSYCAACHHDLHPDTAEIWVLEISCGLSPWRLNVSEDQYFKYLVYDNNVSRWYLNVATDNEMHDTTCELFPKTPSVALSAIRTCEQDVVSSCPEDWTDTTVKEQCEAYTSRLCFGSEIFRNHHCVVCNNASTAYYCNKYGGFDVRVAAPGAPAFSVLLDWRNMKQVHQCAKGDMYDPLSGLCRKVLAVDKTEEENSTETLGSCDKVTFTQEEYELAEDSNSAYVSAHNKTYYKHEFLIHGEFLIMCLPEDTNSRFAPELGYFTVIGLSLSILFLVLHLSVFFLVSRLRNFSATNLSCLCISLLLLYCSFIASESMESRHPGCIILALLIHYSLLASFFWMLTIAFDIFRAMKQATSKLIISKGRQRLRFCLYCIGSWFFPAVIVGVGLAMDSWWPDSPYGPAYGQRACWLNRPDALLIFCVAPLALVVAFNVCFFCWTAYLIHVNSADAGSASSTRKEFPLFLRLGFIMGVTWVIGVLAASVEVPGLWHLFVIFNTLQGLFIFIAFTCTRKVWQEIQNMVYRHKKQMKTTATTTTDTSTNTNSAELAMQEPSSK